MSKYLGDYAKPTGAGTLEFKFSTFRPSTGAAWSLSSGAVVTVYKGGTGNTTGQSTTLTRDWNSITGLNHVSVDLSQAFFEDGQVYEAVITTGTVDSVSVIGACVGRFTLRAQASLYPTTLGRTLDVSAAGEAGIDLANVGSPSATLSLSGTTIKAVTDNVGVGSIAANAITASSIATDAITSAKIATGAITSSQIAANAIGSTQLANDAITAAKIATNAIDGDAVDATAVTKIQSGLSTLTSGNVSSAVWSVPVASYTTTNTFGDRIIRTDGTNGNEVKLSAAKHIAADVHEFQTGVIADADFAAGSVNARLSTMLQADGAVYQYTANALELAPSGGGGGGSTANIHMGPFGIKAEGEPSDAPLDIQKGAAHDIDIQLVDANGTGVNLTGATVSVKVYDSAGTLVATYSATATYGDEGRCKFGITTTTTNTAGTYTATATRTTGATDTQVFGPLRIYVRDI